MDFNEKEIYEAFGLDAEGAKEAEPAEPLLENEAEGGKGQGVADPEDDGAENADRDDAEQDGTDTDEAGEDDAVSSATEESSEGKVAQTPAERAKNASARRKAELDAAVAKARSEAEASAAAELEAFLAVSDLKDPVTGKRITTKADFDAAKAHFAENNRRNAQSKMGMTDDEYEAFIASLPEVKAARAAAEKANAERSQAEITRQLEEIQKIDPSIKGISDLAKNEKFYKFVKENNLSFIDAYKLAFEGNVSKAASEAARQAEINRAAGKNHLSKINARGSGAVSVPREVKEAYLSFNPDATEAEIANHYQKYINK